MSEPWSVLAEPLLQGAAVAHRRGSGHRRVRRGFALLAGSGFAAVLCSSLGACPGSRQLEMGMVMSSMLAEEKAAARAAKERGDKLFADAAKETNDKHEAYQNALSAYEEALRHDPDDVRFYCDCCACLMEMGYEEWHPRRRVEKYVNALLQARECTRRDATFVMGYVKQTAAELGVIDITAKWAHQRKHQGDKWNKNDTTKELVGNVKSIAEGASYSSCEASCRRGLELEPANLALRRQLQALRDKGHETYEAKDLELRDAETAAEMKAKGTAAVSEKNWEEAVGFYTKALAWDPFDHVVYSNRAACYAEMEQFEESLRDSQWCIRRNPQFAKGYSGKAHALFHVGRYVEMEATARAGLALDPSSQELQDLFKQAQNETKETPEVQAALHRIRTEKREEEKMQNLMSKMKACGGDLQGLLKGIRAGQGVHLPGATGSKMAMTEEQMRKEARRVARGPNEEDKAKYDAEWPELDLNTVQAEERANATSL